LLWPKQEEIATKTRDSDAAEAKTVAAKRTVVFLEPAKCATSADAHRLTRITEIAEAAKSVGAKIQMRR